MLYGNCHTADNYAHWAGPKFWRSYLRLRGLLSCIMPAVVWRALNRQCPHLTALWLLLQVWAPGLAFLS